MPRRPDIDAAVEHLGRYAARDDWVARRRAHLDTSLGRIPEQYGLDVDGRTAPPENVSAEDAAGTAEALQSFKDAHYRRTLDEPVPMLGDRTPWQCTRSKQCRARLVRWLKEIENSELRRAARDGTAPYDMA